MVSYFTCLVLKNVCDKIWKQVQSTENESDVDNATGLLFNGWMSVSFDMSVFLEYGMHHIFRGPVADCISAMVLYL